MIRLVQMIATSGALATGVLTLIYFPEIKEALTQEHKTKLTEESDLRLAKQLIDLKRPLEASKLIQAHLSDTPTPAQLEKWLPLFIRATDQLGDTDQLVLIYRHNPLLTAQNESASLKIASHLLAQKDWKSYETLKGLTLTQNHPEKWFLNDADSLILQGKSAEALNHLRSRYLTGSEETQRLLRLSLLQIREHPKLAWEPLQEAHKKSSEDRELGYYKARFLETSGKELLAESEYRSLSQSQENDPFLDSEVADFYLRQNNYKRALTTLTQKLEAGAGSSLWIKALFLGKVYEPLSLETSPDKSVETTPFVSYLLKLPSDRFWDDSLFSKMVQDPSVLNSSEEAFWLRLLEKLSKGYERDAYTLLENPPLSLSEKELADSLHTLLNFRLNGDFKLPLPLQNSALADYFKAIKGEKEPLDEKAKAFLQSPDAVASLFLAKGWNESAMRLFKKSPLAPSTPDWVVFLKATLFFEKGDYESMRETLKLRPDLNESVKGQELLARALLKEGKVEEAKVIYTKIEANSSEAKSYLAKQAFDEKDFHRALNLTKVLLEENPNNPLLQNNMKYIIDSMDR